MNKNVLNRLSRNATLVVLLFIVYGSLLPFNYQPQPFAWQSFLKIPYLYLSAHERADWLANLLLYLPLSFLFCGWLIRGDDPRLMRGAKLILVAIVCLVLAISIEYCQQFFPPRTVSLNDLIAEALGTGIGILLWASTWKYIEHLHVRLSDGGVRAIRAMFYIYALIYLAFSLFPYDFLISFSEISAKLSSGTVGLLFASSACRGMQCIGKLLFEVLAVIPLGILFAMAFAPRLKRVYRATSCVGLLLGFMIELAQFFLASGISQGASVITRAIGLPIGTYIYQFIARGGLLSIKPFFRVAVLLSAVPYLIVVAALNGWFRAEWHSIDIALARLGQLNFIPFFYHYYTTETAAMVSLLVYAAMYMPVAFGFFLWEYGGGTLKPKSSFIPVCTAGLIALSMEAGKLFITHRRADPTDIIIAMLSVWCTLNILRFLTKRHDTTRDVVIDLAGRDIGQYRQTAPARFGVRLFSIGLFAVLLGLVLHYPLNRIILVTLLLVYAILLYIKPHIWLLLIPMILPFGDLSPLSGWVFINELDLFVILTLAIGFWRLYNINRPSLSPVMVWVTTTVFLAYCIGLARGLLPLQALDNSTLFTYLNHYNALRAAKGFFLALALVPLLRLAFSEEAAKAERLFMTGSVIALCAVVIAVAWERFIFTGLFNFSNEYRITGPFPEMHTGGPQIETYLVMVIPFLLVWALTRPFKFKLIIAPFVLLGAVYAVLVTYSRAGYLGLIASILLFLTAWSYIKLRERHVPRLGLFFGVSIALLVVGILLFVAQGTFMSGRLQQAKTDMQIRLVHWDQSLAMIPDTWLNKGFGVGLGAYPLNYYIKNNRNIRPGNYRIKQKGTNNFLSMGAGDSLYMGQRVSTQSYTPYTLSLDLKGYGDAKVELTAYLCEKQLLYSFRCQILVIPVLTTPAEWQHREIRLESADVGAGRWFTQRPVEFSLSVPVENTIVDIDNVRLLDTAGRDLLANGDFENGLEHWLFTTDNAWPWRVENLWLQVLFEQGWFGVIAFSLFMLALLSRLFTHIKWGDVYALGFFASFIGLLVIGLFGSVFESPRLLLFFFLCTFVAELHLNRARFKGGTASKLS